MNIMICIRLFFRQIMLYKKNTKNYIRHFKFKYFYFGKKVEVGIYTQLRQIRILIYLG